MAAAHTQQRMVCIWLPFAIAALLTCALANGWMVYNAAEVILPKQVISKTMTMWAHEPKIAALAIATMFVGLELFAGGIAEQAYATASSEGFARTHALRLGIFAVLLIVIIAGLELGIVARRAAVLQLELDLLRPKMTAYDIKVREADIANTRVTFIMITAATLCLTSLLTGLVVQGFRAIGATIAEVCFKIVFVVGVVIAFLLEVVIFAVPAVFFAAWVVVFVVGTVATWITDILNEFMELTIRRPIRAIVAFWRRLWTPTEIEDATLPPPAANPPEDPPPTPSSANPGTAANGTTTPAPVEYITATTEASQVHGTNGVATTTSSATKHPETPS